MSRYVSTVCTPKYVKLCSKNLSSSSFVAHSISGEGNMLHLTSKRAITFGYLEGSEVPEIDVVELDRSTS